MRAKAVIKLAGLLVFMAGAASAAESGLQRIGTTQKVCQLTGETDWQSGKPTAAKTMSNFGLDAADLGYPIEHNGKLILLFGDSWPTLQRPEDIVEIPPNDAVGIVTTRATPTAANCLGMQIQTVSGATMRIEDKGTPLKIFAAATVTSPEKIQQGYFEVPTGGVSVGGVLYGFFWTDHCAKSHAIKYAPAEPLARPAQRDERCPETDARNSIGRGVMARSADDGKTFTQGQPLPPGFVYSIAINMAVEQGMPETRDTPIYILGAPEYRASVPYLAQASVATFSNPAAWRFFAGRESDGKPKWISYQAWTGAYKTSGPTATTWHPPQAAEIFSGEGGKQACIGEFSLTWNKPLNQWLMVYNCHGIEARVAAEPWGDWSQPTQLLGGKDDMSCKILMSAKGCGERRDFWPARRVGADVVTGGLYAPFVLGRFTQGGANKSAVIYWVLSTWNPYEVNVMRTTIAPN